MEPSTRPSEAHAGLSLTGLIRKFPALKRARSDSLCKLCAPLGAPWHPPQTPSFHFSNLDSDFNSQPKLHTLSQPCLDHAGQNLVYCDPHRLRGFDEFLSQGDVSQTSVSLVTPGPRHAQSRAQLHLSYLKKYPMKQSVRILGEILEKNNCISRE